MRMLVCISQQKLSNLQRQKKIAENRRTLQWIQRVLSENTSSRETYPGRHPKGRTTIVEPRFNEGPRDWQSVLYTEVLFHIFHYYLGKENRSLYRGLRYIEVRYIEVPLLKTRDVHVLSLCQSCIQYSSCANFRSCHLRDELLVLSLNVDVCWNLFICLSFFSLVHFCLLFVLVMQVGKPQHQVRPEYLCLICPKQTGTEILQCYESTSPTGLLIHLQAKQEILSPVQWGLWPSHQATLPRLYQWKI